MQRGINRQQLNTPKEYWHVACSGNLRPFVAVGVTVSRLQRAGAIGFETTHLVTCCPCNRSFRYAVPFTTLPLKRTLSSFRMSRCFLALRTCIRICRSRLKLLACPDLRLLTHGLGLGIRVSKQPKGGRADGCQPLRWNKTCLLST